MVIKRKGTDSYKGDESVSIKSKRGEASKQKSKRPPEPKESGELVQNPLKEIWILCSSPRTTLRRERNDMLKSLKHKDGGTYWKQGNIP